MIHRRILVLFLLGILFIFSGFFVNDNPQIAQENPPPPTVKNSSITPSLEVGTPSSNINSYVKVVGVIDGDTIEVLADGQVEKIRLIGIDAPETVDPKKAAQCFGKEASDEAKKILQGRGAIL